MLLEVMTAAMLAVNTEPVKVNEVKKQTEIQVKCNKNKKTSAENSSVSTGSYKAEFQLPLNNKTKYKTYSEVTDFYSAKAKEAVKEVNSRYKKDGQFLKWVTLPSQQLAKKNGVSHLDSIYSQADKLGKNNKPLVVLGIGGSKHTAEFLLNMTGFDRKRSVYFYSDIDPVSYYNFLKSTGYKIQDLNFLVVSKSGTTFETKDAFLRFENALVNYYLTKGLSKEEAEKKAQTHFAICTDAKGTEKNLRGKIGDKNGQNNNEYLKELYIHDDVGGRFSMFDDAGLFVLAYSGVPKDITTRILKSAEKVNAANLSSNTDKNPGVQGAIFNTFSRDNGYTLIEQQYFGKLFDGAGENWAKQLYLESLKDFDFVIGKAPDSMHYATEGHFSPKNRDKYNTVMTIMTPSISENYKRYTGAIAATYSETTPLKTEILAVENNAVKPEAIGEYIQSKHFETIYMGIIRRLVNGGDYPKVLPEVLQPSVETYKNKFKPGSPFELNPGK